MSDQKKTALVTGGSKGIGFGVAKTLLKMGYNVGITSRKLQAAEEAASELSEKSLKLIMTEWDRKGYVSENYSSITGTGDDERLSSDRFHSWGALFGIMSFMEYGYLERFEKQIK